MPKNQNKQINPEQGLRSIYQALRAFPKDQINKLKPEDIMEVFNSNGGKTKEADGVVAIVIARAAHEVSEDDFVEAMSANELPPIKLSKSEMALLSGGWGKVVSWGAKLLPWAPSAGGKAGMVQDLVTTGISVKAAAAGTSGKLLSVAAAGGKGAVIGSAAVLVGAMVTAGAVGGAIGTAIDRRTGFAAGAGKQGSFSNAFWTNVGRTIGYID